MAKSRNSDFVYFNGVNAVTGGYVLPPMTPHEVALVGLGQKLDEKELSALRARLWLRQPALGVIEGIDPKNLAEAGWGVIFAAGADRRVRDALRPLLEHRKSQAGKRYREYINDRAYRHKPRPESKLQFLARLKVPVTGSVDPARMPYYLLIVGDPETIPYSFQYQLDVQYAVGRIHFDNIEGYERYAQSVVDAETGHKKRSRHITFFGTQNPDDPPSQYSATQLVKPLAKDIAQAQPDWAVRTLLNDDATKERLGKVLGGAETPALLLTASHGMQFPNGHPNQIAQQGALLCQDWPGPESGIRPIPEDQYFSADDVSESAQLSGLVAFHFACFGLGTPKKNDFYRFDEFYRPSGVQPPVDNAVASFVSQLPQRLLSHQNGGALAVVGHVDRCFGYSFMGDDQFGKPMQIAQLGDYKSAIKRLMEGYPVGTALEFFNERYAEVASDLRTLQDEVENGWQYDDWQVVSLWTANYDSRNFIVVGDPAVRLVV